VYVPELVNSFTAVFFSVLIRFTSVVVELQIKYLRCCFTVTRRSYLNDKEYIVFLFLFIY